MERPPVPSQADLDGYDRVIAYRASLIGYGRITISVSGGLAKDYHEETRAHLAGAEKPSTALRRMPPGA